MIPTIFTNGATALTQMSDFTNTSSVVIVAMIVVFAGIALFRKVINGGVR